MKKDVFSVKRAILYLFTLAYTILGMLLHVEVSKLAVGKYKNITGDFIPRQHSVEVSIFVLFVVLAIIVFKGFKGVRRKTTIAFLSLYIITLFIFYQIYSLHPVEIVHLVQYTGVAYLWGIIIDPKRKKFYFSQLIMLAGGLGIVDELLQYYVVAPGHTYLDFNDFLVNVLGAIGGALLFYGFRASGFTSEQKVTPFYLTKRFAALSIILLTTLLLNLFGYLRQSPPTNVKIKPGSVMIIDGSPVIFMERVTGKLGNWLEHFVAGYYYALTPIEGILLLLFLYFLFSLFDPRTLRQFGFKNKRYLNYLNE